MLLVYNPSLKVFEFLFHFVLLWCCGKSIPERSLSNIIMLWWLWMLGCPKVAGLSIELYRMSDDIKYHSEVMIFSFLFFLVYLFLNLYGIFGMCFFLFLKHPPTLLPLSSQIGTNERKYNVRLSEIRDLQRQKKNKVFIFLSLFSISRLLLQFVALEFVTYSRNHFSHFTFGKVHSRLPLLVMF